MAERIRLGLLPRSTRVLYVVMQVVAHVALPLLALLTVWRAVKEPAHLTHLSQRFGLGQVGPRRAVWVYAASLGETRAASPLIRAIIATGQPVLLTHLSPAGMAEGWRLFPDQPLVTHRYMPLDLFWAVRLFLWRAKPRLGLVLEIEIWPAMMIEATRAGVPMVMANGNLLDRSIKPGLRHHLMQLYALFSHIFTRDDAYHARYLSVGVQASRITVVGEMKYDQWIDPAQLAQGAALRARWPGAARVLMIASSVEGEETALMRMVEGLLRRMPDLRVVWVPRSAQRFDAVEQAVAGLGVQRRSTLGSAMDGAIDPGTRVLVGDSLGEMNAYYAMADLVFVGASLIDHGGHNIMEPMALGRPVVMGPSTYGVAFAAGPAAQAGAFESLPDAVALGARIAQLLQDVPALTAMARAAAAFAADQTGAAGRTFAGLQPWLRHPHH